MEDQVRELLRDIADETPPQRTVPPGLVGRARRRIALVVGTAVVAAAAVLAGSIVGVRTLALERPSVNVPATHRPAVSPSVRPAPSPSPARSPSSSPSPSASASPTIAATPNCSYRYAQASVQSEQGAAGTTYVVWKVTNTGPTACRSYAYPGMDFHAPSGWMNEHVHQGTTKTTSASPARIVVPAGGSLYFLSDWSDVGTAGNPSCTQVDRVKVTLPDNFVSLEVPFSGCVTPGSVEVGAVTLHPSGT